MLSTRSVEMQPISPSLSRLVRTRSSFTTELPSAVFSSEPPRFHSQPERRRSLQTRGEVPYRVGSRQPARKPLRRLKEKLCRLDQDVHLEIPSLDHCVPRVTRLNLFVTPVSSRCCTPLARHTPMYTTFPREFPHPRTTFIVEFARLVPEPAGTRHRIVSTGFL